VSPRLRPAAALGAVLGAALSAALGAALPPAGAGPARAAPPEGWIWGVTVDRVQPLDDIVEAVLALPRRMTVRVVLDEGVEPETYRELVERLAPGADLMLELADSFSFRTLDLGRMTAKTRSYLDAFGARAALWEVGNEVNGDWLGPEPEVAAKVVAAYDLVKAGGGRTALTLYYGEETGGLTPEGQMARWAVRHLPARMIAGLDYVFVSYYEEDHPGRRRPDWNRVFRVLARVFPSCRFGLGESGCRVAGAEPDRLRRSYGLRLREPRYVGGCFWWTFVDDMVPRSRPLWRVLADQLEAAR
jgi:hypothetical protein